MAGVRGERAMPGEFRRTQNWIGRPGCTLNEAEFVPPPVPEMQEALSSFHRRQRTYRAAADLAPVGALEPSADALALSERLLRAPSQGLL